MRVYLEEKELEDIIEVELETKLKAISSSVEYLVDAVFADQANKGSINEPA